MKQQKEKKNTGNLTAVMYTTDGKEAGSLEVPESVFNVAWNADLVHEVVTSMMANARTSTANTKGRGEVRGGGKKPWKQKGTGRARHGSSRSPIWRGGGVTHGPLAEKDYSRKINRKARAKALAVSLSKKYQDGEVVFVKGFSFPEPKAKDARTMLTSLSGIKGIESLKGKRKNAAVIVIPGKDVNTEKSFGNFGNISVVQARDLNPVELFTHKYVLIASPLDALATLKARIEGKK